MTTTASAIAAGLTAAMPKALRALSTTCWLTASEVKNRASSASLDVLYVMRHRTPLCERRWVKWGSDRVAGMKRGEGYEYRLTPLGAAVRDLLPATRPEPASPSNGRNDA